MSVKIQIQFAFKFAVVWSRVDSVSTIGTLLSYFTSTFIWWTKNMSHIVVYINSKRYGRNELFISSEQQNRAATKSNKQSNDMAKTNHISMHDHCQYSRNVRLFEIWIITELILFAICPKFGLYVICAAHTRECTLNVNAACHLANIKTWNRCFCRIKWQTFNNFACK